VIPLTVLYALESGVLTALVRMLKMMLTLGPIFFMLEIETKVRTAGGANLVYRALHRIKSVVSGTPARHFACCNAPLHIPPRRPTSTTPR
jgi:hypothetical protein